MNADQVLVFDEGRIVQKGNHDELVNQPGMYQDIYEIQARIDSALQEEIERVDLL
jgi:ATP-binding cassette subfamily B protein